MKENITKHRKMIKGKRVGNYTEQDEHEFVKRCRTLTERLIEHLAKFDHSGDLVNLGIVTGFASVYRDAMRKLPEIKKSFGIEP